MWYPSAYTLVRILSVVPMQVVITTGKALPNLIIEGTWCSWLSRSLSTLQGDLREVLGSIPNASIFAFSELFCHFQIGARRKELLQAAITWAHGVVGYHARLA